MERAKRYTITLDDDPMMAPIIARTTGIPSLAYTSSEALLRRASSYEPIAVFIDVHLGLNDSGIDIIPHLREIWKYSAFIIITSDDNADIVGDALAAGANDFIRKPIQGPELVGRLQARLAEMNNLRYRDEVVIGDLVFFKNDGVVRVGEKTVYLPKLEAKLFTVLLENREMMVTKENLKRRLWGELNIAGNTLDKRISKLRGFLAELQASLRIEVDYGKGVCLKLDKHNTVKTAG
ncbi:MAG: response regulator transcription factor [Oligoflexus sp.]|nr:response regulator transcription factor [Oligoflexus sp.]